MLKIHYLKNFPNNLFKNRCLISDAVLRSGSVNQNNIRLEITLRGCCVPTAFLQAFFSPTLESLQKKGDFQFLQVNLSFYGNLTVVDFYIASSVFCFYTKQFCPTVLPLYVLFSKSILPCLLPSPGVCPHTCPSAVAKVGTVFQLRLHQHHINLSSHFCLLQKMVLITSC